MYRPIICECERRSTSIALSDELARSVDVMSHPVFNWVIELKDDTAACAGVEE